MFQIYALYNKERNKIYIGYSSDLIERLKRHNKELPTKKNSYTSLNSGKWDLIYKEDCQIKKQAMQREKQLKSARGREFIWSIIEKRNK
ncbi:GIY-YIG nuclease family protein [Candidatus Microgenomates bacterium]|nr:MAG: GIY-YIG nuclease family protein [Candidatus Microgenomates bacterium]